MMADAQDIRRMLAKGRDELLDGASAPEIKAMVAEYTDEMLALSDAELLAHFAS